MTCPWDFESLLLLGQAGSFMPFGESKTSIESFCRSNASNKWSWILQVCCWGGSKCAIRSQGSWSPEGFSQDRGSCINRRCLRQVPVQVYSVLCGSQSCKLYGGTCEARKRVLTCVLLIWLEVQFESLRAAANTAAISKPIDVTQYENAMSSVSAPQSSNSGAASESETITKEAPGEEEDLPAPTPATSDKSKFGFQDGLLSLWAMWSKTHPCTSLKALNCLKFPEEIINSLIGFLCKSHKYHF